MLRLLAAAAGWLVPGPVLPAGDRILDQGIGGTGIRPGSGSGSDPEGDRGIGGTGVVGTIRDFGSIVVNGLRIAYPPDAAVTIDGRPASVADLRLGQVVRVVAREGESGLTTARIAVEREVTGPVEAVGRGRLRVLGQRVATAGMTGPAQGWRIGDRVAVSGLRRPDGSIAASLIEPAGAAGDRVTGPVRRIRDGGAEIGALRLRGLDPALIGRRTTVEGDAVRGGLAVSGAQEAATGFGPGVARLSVEGYVTRSGGGLRLGSGLVLDGAGAARVSGGLAVVEARVSPNGQVRVESVRSESPGPGRSGAPDGSGPRGGAGAPGGGSAPGGGAAGGSRGGDRPGGDERPGRPGGGDRPGGFGRPERSGGVDAPGGGNGLRGLDIDRRVPGSGGFGRPDGGFGGFGAPGGFGRDGGDRPGGAGRVRPGRRLRRARRRRLRGQGRGARRRTALKSPRRPAAPPNHRATTGRPPSGSPVQAGSRPPAPRLPPRARSRLQPLERRRDHRPGAFARAAAACASAATAAGETVKSPAMVYGQVSFPPHLPRSRKARSRMCDFARAPLDTTACTSASFSPSSRPQPRSLPWRRKARPATTSTR
ncbi:MAG: DUF5666 domain-containing protein [Methylobacterium frigidaeris]